MPEENSRRDFIKLSLLAGGLTPCMGGALPAQEKQADPCQEKMKKMAGRIAIRNYQERLALAKKLLEKFGPEVTTVIQEHTIAGIKQRMQKTKIEKRDLDAEKNSFGITWIKKISSSPR